MDSFLLLLWKQQFEFSNINWDELVVGKAFSTIKHETFSLCISTLEHEPWGLVRHETFSTFSTLEHETFDLAKHETFFLRFSTFEHETMGLVKHETFSLGFSTFEQETLELFEHEMFSTTRLHNLNELLLY